MQTYAKITFKHMETVSNSWRWRSHQTTEIHNLQFWSILHIDDEHLKSSTPIHGCHFAPVLQQKPHLAWFSFCQCQVCTQQRASTQYCGAWKCAVEGSVPLRVEWQGTMLGSAAEFCVCGSRFRAGDFSVKGTPPTKAFCLIHSSPSTNRPASCPSISHLQ